MEEKWTDIEGYRGIYEVSNLGNVRSVDRTINYSDGRSRKFKGKVLTVKVNKNGDRYAMLKNKEGKYTEYVIDKVKEEKVSNVNVDVVFDSLKSKWRAYMTYNGKENNLGWFYTKKDAYKACDRATKV